MKIKYSFSLPPAAPATLPAPAKLVEHLYNEFRLDLSEHWRQIPTSEDNSFNWYSETERASITVSADFYEISEGKANALAEKCLTSRNEALEKVAPGRVRLIERTCKPHSGGIGLELSFVAEIPGECVYLYLGYVTPRKVFNFTLVCPPDQVTAFSLYNTTVRNIRVMLP